MNLKETAPYFKSIAGLAAGSGFSMMMYVIQHDGPQEAVQIIGENGEVCSEEAINPAIPDEVPVARLIHDPHMVQYPTPVRVDEVGMVTNALRPLPVGGGRAVPGAKLLRDLLVVQAPFGQILHWRDVRHDEPGESGVVGGRSSRLRVPGRCLMLLLGRWPGCSHRNLILLLWSWRRLMESLSLLRRRCLLKSLLCSRRCRGLSRRMLESMLHGLSMGKSTRHRSWHLALAYARRR